MAKKLYKAKNTGKLPLGGIGTGHIYMGCTGSITGDSCPLFVIKAEKDGELLDARVLQGKGQGSTYLPCFENADCSSYFPFAEVCLCDSEFPADVKITAFSPFIPLCDTDSGIPGVLFEFEVTNKLDERIDFSVCSMAQNVNLNAYNRMGCTETGEAYVFFSGKEEYSGNSCVATNGKNVSFCEYSPSFEECINNFKNNTTVVNATAHDCKDKKAVGALSTNFSIVKGETQKVVFCYSWYQPNNNFSRNYYAQYFESALECASYLFRHMERLYSGSCDFCENVLGATLPESVLEDVNADLFRFSGKEHLRLDDGVLVSQEDFEFYGIESFVSRQSAAESLFPSLDYSKIQHFYVTSEYETADERQLFSAVLKSYRKYVLCGDADALIEDWYYVVKCLERLFGEDGMAKCKLGLEMKYAAVFAASEMAEVVHDKKRYELYFSMLQNLPVIQFSMNISEGFAKINEMSGFFYSAAEKYIGFNPQSNACPLDDGGTFRCFFCTPTCFGYVEEGIDYIEINLLQGVLKIRKFGVPRTPRLVQYGGRNWKFENKNLVTELDSDLEITPQKKLTVFIDIKQ